MSFEISSMSDIKQGRRYPGERKKYYLRRWIVPLLVKNLGPENLQNIGGIAVFISIAGLISYFIIYNAMKFINMPVPNDYWYATIVFFIALMFLGGLFLIFHDYYLLTKCWRCGHDFSFKEIGAPEVDEYKEGRTGVRVITRSYQCSVCGNEKTVVETEKDEPISYSDQA